MELTQSVPIVVIVPGSKTKVSTIPLLRTLLQKFYAHYGVQVEGDAWLPALQASLAAIPAEVHIFSWSGGISPFALRRAAQELQQALLQYQGRDMYLFTKSLGSTVATIAAQDSRLNIKTVVYVAAPHYRFALQPPASARVINIYSKSDTYQQLANRVLYWGFGRVLLPRAHNVEIPGLRHSDFNHNIEVVYGTQRRQLFDVYRELLAEH